MLVRREGAWEGLWQMDGGTSPESDPPEVLASFRKQQKETFCGLVRRKLGPRLDTGDA